MKKGSRPGKSGKRRGTFVSPRQQHKVPFSKQPVILSYGRIKTWHGRLAFIEAKHREKNLLPVVRRFLEGEHRRILRNLRKHPHQFDDLHGY